MIDLSNRVVTIYAVVCLVTTSWFGVSSFKGWDMLALVKFDQQRAKPSTGRPHHGRYFHIPRHK